MKRMILLAALAIATQTVSADEVSSNPNTNQTQDSTLITIPKQYKGLKEIALRVEPLTADQIKNGLSDEAVHDMVVKRLEEAEIPISSVIQQPLLVLRVRSIQSGVDIATYFQLSLMEESMLLRNRSTFNAITWSQASLLTCRPEDLQKEVSETVDAMIQAFSKDYKKAFSTTVSK